MMRDYAKVSPLFWTGKTGKYLRRRTIEAPSEGLFLRCLACYLISCPHANMIGIFHMPVVYIAADLGLMDSGSEEKILAGLDELGEMGFCIYDAESEMIFVENMARYQIGATLKPGDKRKTYIERELRQQNSPEFVAMFVNRYAEAYNLDLSEDGNAPSMGHRRGLQGASKAHRSQKLNSSKRLTETSTEKSACPRDDMSDEIPEELPSNIETLRAVWQECGLHRSDRAGQGWHGKRIEKRVDALAAEVGLDALRESIRRYARKIQEREDWAKYAFQFSTFFGPDKEPFRDFLDGALVGDDVPPEDTGPDAANLRALDYMTLADHYLWPKLYTDPAPELTLPSELHRKRYGRLPEGMEDYVPPSPEEGYREAVRLRLVKEWEDPPGDPETDAFLDSLGGGE